MKYEDEIYYKEVIYDADFDNGIKIMSSCQN